MGLAAEYGIGHTPLRPQIELGFGRDDWARGQADVSTMKRTEALRLESRSGSCPTSGLAFHRHTQLGPRDGFAQRSDLVPLTAAWRAHAVDADGRPADSLSGDSPCFREGRGF